MNKLKGKFVTNYNLRSLSFEQVNELCLVAYEVVHAPEVIKTDQVKIMWDFSIHL